MTRQATTGGATRTLDFAYDDRGNLTSKTSSVTGDLDATAYAYGTAGRQIGVLNATLRNHALDLGEVRRGPVLIAGGYRIGTVSLGTGWWGFPNVVGGPFYWRGVDRRVIDRVRGRLRR